MSAAPRNESVHNHTALPARPDLIRLIIGIFGVGSSGPLIALSAMPVPTLIFWSRWWKAMAGADCPDVVVLQDMSGRQIAHEIQRAPEYLAARLAFPGTEGDGPQALPRALRLLDQ